MANKAFKVKNGLQAGRYLLSTSSGEETIQGYNISDARYDSVSFSLSSQDTGPASFAMKDDGTALYMHGASNDRLYQYTLSTAWDLSSISYASKFFITSTQNGNAGPVAFKIDGTSFYVSGSTNDTVYQYDMSTAWDISTASYASKSFSLSGQEGAPSGLFFKSDGTKMYMVGSGTDSIYQYSLSTAWDVSTASYDSVSFSLSSQGTSTASLYFKSDGTEFYTTDSNGVFKYSLSTAWDISTTSYVGTFNTTVESTNPYQIWLKSDGIKMFVLGQANDTIYQYTTASYTQTLDLSTGTTFAFTPSGDTTVSFTNPPASGVACSFTVDLSSFGGGTISWPTSVKWHEATTPSSTGARELYSFITVDGGTTYYGRRAAEDLK